jgi:transposase
LKKADMAVSSGVEKLQKGNKLMSTSLLYHGWGVRGYTCCSTTFREGEVCFRVEQNPDSFRCSLCGSSEVMRSGQIPRRFRSLPIGGKRVWIDLPIQRLWCIACTKIRQAKVAFADQRRGYTHAFERYALDLSRHMTIKAVACHLGIGWDAVKEIQKRRLQVRFKKPKLKRLKHMAIDEISIGRGHRYLTVVLDLDSGAVVFVGEGKGADSLHVFWRRLRGSHARVRAVATDMSPAYTAAVRDNLPRAIHVFDRFHVVKLFNEKFSLFRQELQREAEGPLAKKVLKGTRWLLLKNPENLDDERDERKRLEKALALNKPLATVYYMKEDLRQIWDQQDKPAAEVFLNDWIARARASGIRMLQKFAQTLVEHRRGILNYYQCPITTAALEGTNNKIRTMQRQAYGFRDHEFFKLKIYALHETTYALVG